MTEQPLPSVSVDTLNRGSPLSEAETRISFYSGLAIGLLAVLSVVTLAPDFIASTHYTCGVRTADGCVVWVNKSRADRFAAGKAGTPRVLYRLPHGPNRF